MVGNVGSSETIRRIPRMTRDMAVLLGLLYTDGCVSRRQPNSWRIYFAVTSEQLIKLFRDSAIAAFHLEPSRVRMGTTRYGLYKAVIDSKEIGSYLTSEFGTFRTLRFKDGKLTNARLPLQQLIESGYARDFLRSAFTCDGGLRFYPASRSGRDGGTRWLIRTVFLSCTHPLLRDDYTMLLEHMGIRASNSATDGKLKIEREHDIRLFAAKIGFVPGVKVTGNSKFWQGCEKNALLEKMIASYEIPSKFYQLPVFVR